MLCDIVERQRAFAFGGGPSSVSNQCRQTGVSQTICCKQDNGRRVRRSDFCTDQQFQIGFFRCDVGADHSCDTIAIGDCKGSKPEFGSFIDQVVGM